MKRHLLSLFLIFFGSIVGIQAQSEDHEKLDNLRYFNMSIKDNVESMRYYTDSTNVLDILSKIENLTTELDVEFERVVLPEVPLPDTETYEENMEENMEENIYSENYDFESESFPSGNDEGLGVAKFIPFGNKIKTKFKVEFGVNLLLDQAESSNILKPDVNPGRSWFWEMGLYNQSRIGSKESKVAINYGISYLINRFTFDNDVRLVTDLVDRPIFVEVTDLTKGPKLNIGYLTIPLSLKIALAKKSSIEIGGYAGYRVHTVQKFQSRINEEDIKSSVYARHQLNNWVYGTSVSLRIKSFTLLAKYNLSNVFKNAENYDFRTLMIGTAIRL